MIRARAAVTAAALWALAESPAASSDNVLLSAPTGSGKILAAV